MRRYNEQHATTMLNALIGTDTLSDHDKQIRVEVINEVFAFLKNKRTDRTMKLNFDDFEIRTYKNQLMESGE